MNVSEIHSVESIDRITLAKTLEEARLFWELERQDGTSLQADDTRDEHVVKRIVRHKDDSKRTIYLVRCYDYDPTDDLTAALYDNCSRRVRLKDPESSVRYHYPPCNAVVCRESSSMTYVQRLYVYFRTVS